MPELLPVLVAAWLRVGPRAAWDSGEGRVATSARNHLQADRHGMIDDLERFGTTEAQTLQLRALEIHL